MKYSDAYAEGFCKAAEVLGVSPVLLAKKADLSPAGEVKWLDSIADKTRPEVNRKLWDVIGRMQGRMTTGTYHNVAHMDSVSKLLDEFRRVHLGNARTPAIGMRGSTPFKYLLDTYVGARRVVTPEAKAAAGNILRLIRYIR